MFNKKFYRLAERAAVVAGFPIQPLFIYLQWCHETNLFTSELCLNTCNLAGLCQFTPNQFPQPDGSLYYMQFASYDDCAEYFGRYLRLYYEDGLYSSYSIETYAAALKNGGYFGDSLENYIGGMLYYAKQIQNV